MTDRSNESGRHLFWLALGLLFALPLLANVVTVWLGYSVFYLADRSFQFIWVTLVAVTAIWPAPRALGRAGPSAWLAILAGLAVALAYAGGVWLIFFAQESDPGLLYVLFAVLMLLLRVGRLVTARRQGGPSTRKD